MANTNSYTGVTVHDGLSGIRHQIPMYLGSTGVVSEKHAPRALTQMAQEVMSNSRDEIVAGYGDVIKMVIHPDNSMTITDHGRGIPKGPGNSFEQVVRTLTKPHSSGKFDSTAYASAGVAGMHGIGITAVNAASEWVRIDAVAYATKSTPDGDVLTGKKEKYTITLSQEDVIDSYREDVHDDAQTGTSVTFKPDTGIISETKRRPVLESDNWTVNDLLPMLESTAFLMPGTKVEFIDERGDEPFEQSWFYENGLSDYVDTLTEGQSVIDGVKEPIRITETTNVDGYDISVDAALTFTQDSSSLILSYANGVPTREGGPHKDGFTSAIVAAFNDANTRLSPGGKKKKGQKLLEQDVLSGLTAAFEVKVPGEIAAFEGQTKEKLGTVQARKAVKDIIENRMIDWFTDNEKTTVKILKSALLAAESRVKLAQERKEHQAAKKGAKGGKLVTSSKLKTASSRTPSEKELYIVEGDSASEIGRDPRTQAVFPIRGKILNVKKSTLSDALRNVEISTLIATIGTGIGPEFNIDGLQYHKIIIAADADSDGSHIRMLLLTLFYEFMPELIEAGYVYILEPPLYRAEKYTAGKRDLVVAYTDAEMRKMREELNGYKISRYKGLGMMEPDEAHRYIADPDHRLIKRVTMPDALASRKKVNVMMGDDAQPRRQWIESSVNFNNTADKITV